MSQYPPSGALFRKDKKTEQSPDMDGYVEIDDQMLSDIAQEIQASSDRKTKLHIACWTRESKSGMKFMSIKPRTETAREAQRAAYSGGSASQGGGGPQGASARHGSSHDPLDDSIPF
jgi:hypothetical protein